MSCCPKLARFVAQIWRRDLLLWFVCLACQISTVVSSLAHNTDASHSYICLRHSSSQLAILIQLQQLEDSAAWIGWWVYYEEADGGLSVSCMFYDSCFLSLFVSTTLPLSLSPLFLLYPHPNSYVFVPDYETSSQKFYGSYQNLFFSLLSGV